MEAFKSLRGPPYLGASLVPLHYVLGKRNIPVVPLFVNTYVPPQPAPRRCYALGVALGELLRQRPERPLGQSAAAGE